MSMTVSFLYRTKPGRILLCLLQKSRADKLIVKFLHSPFSKPCIGLYIKRHGIPMQEYGGQNFRTFRDFFARKRPAIKADLDPAHLISPCDGRLSAYPITEDSRFLVKGSLYRICDLLKGSDGLHKTFYGGICLIFRLAPSDYHHYCYIDDGYQGENHYIPGILHSVQPIACEAFPVYTMNRRVWTLFETENFGQVAQIEIGALVVGGIVNEQENCQVFRGMEMGHFELSGSTIILLFQKGQASLLPDLQEELANGNEVFVRQGCQIGNARQHNFRK